MKKSTKADAQLKSAVSRRAGKSFAELIDKGLRQPEGEGSQLSVKERIVKTLIGSALNGDTQAIATILDYSRGR